MAKVRKGFEKHTYYGTVNGKRIFGTALGDLSESDLQAILDIDPKNAGRMIEGKPGAKVQDNKPNDTLPKAPKEKSE